MLLPSLSEKKKNAASFLFLLKSRSTSSITSQPPSQPLEQKSPHFSSKTSLGWHLQCITVRSANGPEIGFHIVPHFGLWCWEYSKCANGSYSWPVQTCKYKM